MPYGKTPMKKKGSMMHMGHSPAEMGHSPMKMQGSWMSKHSSSALHMGHSPMKMESDKQKETNLLQEMPIDKKASALEMGHSPMKKYGPLNMPGNSPEHARNPAKDDGHLHYDRTTNQPRKKK